MVSFSTIATVTWPAVKWLAGLTPVRRAFIGTAQALAERTDNKIDDAMVVALRRQLDIPLVPSTPPEIAATVLGANAIAAKALGQPESVATLMQNHASEILCDVTPLVKEHQQELRKLGLLTDEDMCFLSDEPEKL